MSAFDDLAEIEAEIAKRPRFAEQMKKLGPDTLEEEILWRFWKAREAMREAAHEWKRLQIEGEPYPPGGGDAETWGRWNDPRVQHRP